MGTLIFKKIIFLLLLLLVGQSRLAGQTWGQSPTRPNVLFIAVDDLRPQLGCYGDKIAVTPNIDGLARRGIVFNKAYCQQAVCAPSRASLMTGLRPNTLKVWDLETHFRKNLPEVITLPQYLKGHGYFTQCIGKIYHDPASAQDSLSWSAPEIMAVTETKGKYALPENLNRSGSWKATASEQAEVDDNAYIDGQVAGQAVRFLQQKQQGPFFLAVGFRRPHLPFSAPRKYWDLYRRESIPLPQPAQAPENVPAVALHNWDELRGYSDVPDTGVLTPETQRELLHGYYASVSYVDAQVGRVLHELKLQGLDKNTIIVLWSDHGFHLGEHNLWCKTTNFELDTRVPLIVSVPGQPTGIKTDALVELVDLYPTLTELCYLPQPKSLEGTSLVPLLRNPRQEWKKAAFSQFPRPWMYKNEPQLMGYSIRTLRYRYTEWQDFRTGQVQSRELYDHRRDPNETKNVADLKENTPIVSQLHMQLQKGWQDAIPVSNNH